MKKTIAVTICLLLAIALVRKVNGRQHDSRIAPKESANSQQELLSRHDRNATGYDPLQKSDREIKTVELIVFDADRNRKIPVLVYLPEATEPMPVVIHSHGLGGTRYTSAFLGKHWAARGFVAVFVQHPGSDDSVWKDLPKLRRMKAMRKAASPENLKLRAGDATAVIDQLERWNDKKAHSLNSRMDLERIGMSGHSFGALTTQYVGGQNVIGSPRFADERVSAAIPMSPSAPRIGDPSRAFGDVQIPWLCMTGTHDKAMIGGATVENRLSVFPALPAGDKYELVLNKAEHSAFVETSLPGDKQERNPSHHLAIMALSAAFWDAYLSENEDAKNWLTSEDARSVLETEDRWQIK